MPDSFQLRSSHPNCKRVRILFIVIIGTVWVEVEILGLTFSAIYGFSKFLSSLLELSDRV